ncbi:hypothetical protein B0G75_103558 [Paraburkholderia sp. BL18I3N2]|nr:hypothetical protein B0G75_103558 [Paraburkholderia sp. BL18I3N2]
MQDGTLNIAVYVTNLSKRKEHHPAVVRRNAHHHTLRVTLRLRSIAPMACSQYAPSALKITVPLSMFFASIGPALDDKHIAHRIRRNVSPAQSRFESFRRLAVCQEGSKSQFLESNETRLGTPPWGLDTSSQHPPRLFHHADVLQQVEGSIRDATTLGDQCFNGSLGRLD